jgi:hypothetical protein
MMYRLVVLTVISHVFDESRIYDSVLTCCVEIHIDDPQ